MAIPLFHPQWLGKVVMKEQPKNWVFPMTLVWRFSLYDRFLLSCPNLFGSPSAMLSVAMLPFGVVVSLEGEEASLEGEEFHFGCGL